MKATAVATELPDPANPPPLRPGRPGRHRRSAAGHRRCHRHPAWASYEAESVLTYNIAAGALVSASRWCRLAVVGSGRARRRRRTLLHHVECPVLVANTTGTDR